jgi:hypothetical protein
VPACWERRRSNTMMMMMMMMMMNKKQNFKNGNERKWNILFIYFYETWRRCLSEAYDLDLEWVLI